MSPERNLVLIAVDGSEMSTNVVRYISSAVNLSKSEVVLLSVVDKVPDVFWDFEKDRTVAKHQEHMEAWDKYKCGKLQDCMDGLCRMLEEAGVPRQAIVCNVKKREQGIARDIIDECKYGYNAVAVARTGLGDMDESMLGSVAAKVFINVADSPVCLVGGKPAAGKILVGLDSSMASLRVVDFVGKMLCNGDPQIKLVHVLRVPTAEDDKLIDPARAKEAAKEHEKLITPIFEDAIKSLVECGAKRKNIKTEIIRKAGSRAVAINEKAKSEGFDTIVIGRKGLSDVQEFQLGRVAYKLGQVARGKALWLVP